MRITFLLLFVAFCAAQEEHLYTYQVIQFETVDGDSIRAQLDLGFDLTLNVDIRVAGIDTPETNPLATREAGEKAEAYTAYWLSQADAIYFQVTDEAKYAGRTVGRVFTADGGDLATYLVQAGVAKVYTGGRRPGFSAEEAAAIAALPAPEASGVPLVYSKDSPGSNS